MNERELVHDMMSGVSEGIAFFDVISERSFRGCLRVPATLYPEYVPDPNRNYLRGTVLKMPDDNVSKYVFTGDGRIPNDRPPGHPEQRQLRLVRNRTGRFRHVREEFCEQGMWRWWDADPNRQEQHGWYELIVPIFDGNQDPPQIPQIWAFRGNENPPE
jgi:hypothetical protein